MGTFGERTLDKKSHATVPLSPELPLTGVDKLIFSACDSPPFGQGFDSQQVHKKPVAVGSSFEYCNWEIIALA